jgi:hypothetical protein
MLETIAIILVEKSLNRIPREPWAALRTASNLVGTIIT